MKPLKINDLFANKPIVQGGMGIGISLSNLAGSVALEGGIGVISAAQPGYLNKYFEKNPLKTNLEALKLHISLAKKKSCQGIIGVNVMSAIKNYEEYVLCAIKNKADIIFSVAGMPLNLPKLVEGSKAKIAPIISSVKACSVLFKIWDKRYQRTADALVVEGPKAGGHLGFKEAELGNDFENELIRIIELIRTYEQKYKKDMT